MPKIWSQTVEAHRQAVRTVALDAVGPLVAECGMRSVTMSRIAADAGIGRGTLYKYFQDVDAILLAWHEREIAAHLEQLVEARDGAASPMQALETVLTAYAEIVRDSHGRHGNELAAVLHRDGQISRAQQQVGGIVGDLLVQGAQNGDIRDDVPAEELAHYCLHALSAASAIPSEGAIERLVEITMDGLRRHR